uniref:Heptahelical transmembrane protein 4-like n=1 Tax=Araucaria cunninghamii TaxID=56994 RepID=A0A0D6QZK3_ARACU
MEAKAQSSFGDSEFRDEMMSRISEEFVVNDPVAHDKDDVVSPGRANRLWKKVKYQLVEYHALPEYLRDNEYILKYYRVEWPMKQVLLSMFSIHNETLNVWTHLVGFFIFLCLTVYTATKLPKVVDLTTLQNLPHIPNRADFHKLQSELMTSFPSLPNKADFQRLQAELKTALPSLSHWHLPEVVANCLPESLSHANRTEQCLLQTVKKDLANMIAQYLQQPITRWPFFVFLGGAMFCLLSSSVCHLISCHSELLSYIMLRVDYAGIAALIATSFYPPVYYSFICNPFLRNMYLSIITSMGIASSLASLLPVFQNPEFRTFRASLFFGMGVSGIAPIVHKLILHWDEPLAVYTTAYEVVMGASYGLGALVYAMRIPERWKPGRFDIAGNSHQLFHVLVVIGAFTHYKAGLLYLQWRDLKGC